MSYPRSASDVSGLKQRAVEDGRAAQLAVEKTCKAEGRDVPPYRLSELIGKGSFGRVYKAIDSASSQIVAVKIISIEDGDSLNPHASDTFSDILKEVNTLKRLAESGAKNINPIIETLLIGHSMWMVTEYCAGGSVSTLMRPTRGLPEQWIIPILREVAEALSWVHKQGIIHRDIKCANVFVTEDGSVQLGDFGVAGIVETTFDKRSTVTGTLHWMAPELFQSNVSYGTEVDIWAFGSMAFEIASGLPPNAKSLIDIRNFGSRLRQNCPRLEGDQYSSRLKDLVACCLVEDPADRPSIEGLQIHPYIVRSEADYPTASLAKLVKAYKLWEAQGGSRLSLFSPGGVPEQFDEDNSSPTDEWNFTITDNWDEIGPQDAQKLFDNVYHPNARPQTPKVQPRRRKPPANLKNIPVPLEKVFDRNTISNYKENAQNFYSGPNGPEAGAAPGPSESRTTSAQEDRESMIDLDASPALTDTSWLADPDTIRPTTVLGTDSSMANRRRTLDWTFAAAGVDEETASWDGSEDNSRSTSPVTESSQSNFDYDHISSNSATSRMSAMSLIDLDEGLVDMVDMDIPATYAPPNRASTVSLIDLDESLGGDFADTMRPSTASSDITSESSGTVKEFGLKRHATEPTSTREPSIYVDDFDLGSYPLADTPEVIELDLPPHESSAVDNPLGIDDKPLSPMQSPMQSPLQSPVHEAAPSRNLHPAVTQRSVDMAAFIPALPPPPSANVMQSPDLQANLRDELQRLISSLGEHLEWSSAVLETLPSNSNNNAK